MDGRPRLTLERTFDAEPEEAWELWTTAAGIESWWGPDGFQVRAHGLDVRPGGVLDYSMVATGSDQIDFLSKAGMPLKTRHRLRFSEVDRPRRLAYTEMADFIPGVKPYEVSTVIELVPMPPATRLVLTFDRMHDERWTQLAVMGRESELTRLAARLAKPS